MKYFALIFLSETKFAAHALGARRGWWSGYSVLFWCTCSGFEPNRSFFRNTSSLSSYREAPCDAKRTTDILRIEAGFMKNKSCTRQPSTTRRISTALIFWTNFGFIEWWIVLPALQASCVHSQNMFLAKCLMVSDKNGRKSPYIKGKKQSPFSHFPFVSKNSRSMALIECFNTYCCPKASKYNEVKEWVGSSIAFTPAFFSDCQA